MSIHIRMDHSERVKRSLEAIDALEHYIKGHEDEIINCKIEFEGNVKPGRFQFGQDRESASPYKIVPFLRSLVVRSSPVCSAYICFEDWDYLRPNIEDGCITGWQLWNGKRIGPTKEQIMNNQRLRDLHPTELATQVLLKELRSKADEIATATLFMGIDRNKERLYYKPGNAKYPTPEHLFSFIERKMRDTNFGQGKIILDSGRYYQPSVSNGIIYCWKYWDYTLI
jgi:hypothetical protein